MACTTTAPRFADFCRLSHHIGTTNFLDRLGARRSHRQTRTQYPRLSHRPPVAWRISSTAASRSEIGIERAFLVFRAPTSLAAMSSVRFSRFTFSHLSAAAKKGLKVLWFATGVEDGLMPTTKSTVELFSQHGFTPVFLESDGAHTWLWLAALAVMYGGAALSGSTGWQLHPTHFAERYGLVVIIALGEAFISIGIGATGQRSPKNVLETFFESFGTFAAGTHTNTPRS